MSDQDNPPVQISHAIIYAGAIATPQSAVLRNQLAFLNQPTQPQQGVLHLPCTGLLIVLSSWGGSVFEARSLSALIRALPFPTEIHAVGNIKSSALPLMLAADRRTAAPGTTFFFHPWTWSTELHPGHSLQALQQAPTQLEDDISWGKQTLIKRSRLTESDIEQMGLFNAGRNEDTEFALKYGLVHEVIERKIPAAIMTWNIA
jgi:ATP-dependent protease ClpP protease subunit